ncbi:MAG: HlyD family secretion protein [Myxococcales bacterium]
MSDHPHDAPAPAPAGPAARRRLRDRMPRFSRRRPFLVLGGLAALVALGVTVYLVATAGQESTDDAQVDADVVALAPRVSGLVLRLRVHENERVRRGQLLLEIDDADYAAKVSEAEAALQTAQAQAEAAGHQVAVAQATAQGGLSSAQAEVAGSSVQVDASRAQARAARAGLRKAEADRRKARTDLERTQRLREGGAATQQQLDNAQEALESAQAAVAQRQAEAAAAEEGARVAQTGVAQAQGKLAQSSPAEAQIAIAEANARLAQARAAGAQAALNLARLQWSYTRVYAPADGVVSELSAREGQLAQAGQPVAMVVPDGSYVVANFKETQIGRMRPGQRATVKVDAFGGRKFEGRVESLSGGTGARFSILPPENATGNFVKVVQRVPVRIAWVRPPDVPLRAGLSTNVTVFVDP